MQGSLVEPDAHPLVLVRQRSAVLRELALDALLVRLAELLHRVPVGTHLLRHLADHVYVRIRLAITLIQFLALIATGREKTTVFS